MGISPSSHVTWFQAKRACENSEKQLCNYPAAWVPACMGEPPAAFPYGATFIQGHCNDGWNEAGGALTTGDKPSCHGRGFASDIYDMSGNLWEWTSSCGSTSQCWQSGGGFSEVNADLLSCEDGHLLVGVLEASQFAGFRCCWTPQ
ncbi:uncharacterized protein METZ01_LOCUS426446 [marine metagenome]|uniref:Sulfatase-modifying factor enzyme-like domain-containing protein n=1 Tax=marine metagenome TaxID=408172 RepID=A0A382XR41_9ZZZZ